MASFLNTYAFLIWFSLLFKSMICSFESAFDILNAVKGDVTDSVDTHFAATLDKLDNAATLIGYTVFCGIGVGLLPSGGVGYGLGSIDIRLGGVEVGSGNGFVGLA